MKKTHFLMASLVVVLLAALSGVSYGVGSYTDPANLLLNKTIAAQHPWYGSGGLGVLVDNSAGSWYLFAGTAWNGVYWEQNNYVPDPDMRVSVSGFNSAVGTVRYWGGWAAGGDNRCLNGVTIYSSTVSTSSLETGDYVLPVHFEIPLDTAEPWVMPEGWTNVPGTGNYYDFAYSAPAGTQSLLLKFENAGIPNNIANEIYKLQAFAPTTGDLVIEKYNDVKGDGSIEGDPLLADWTFGITYPDQTTGSVTDNQGGDMDPADGIIMLTGLALGDYTVSEIAPGWTCTYDTDGGILGTVLVTIEGGLTKTVQFGNTSGSGAVPEPASLALLGLAGLAIRRKRRVLMMAMVAVLAVSVVSTAQAATMSWGTATNIAGGTDVLTTGAPVYAYAFGTDVGPQTVNTVAFSVGDGSGGGTDVTITGTGLACGSYFPLSSPPTYNGILKGAVFGNTGFGPDMTVALNNLVEGQEYAVQVWSSNVDYDGSDTTYDGAVSLDVKPGQYAIGTFTADGTGSQVMSLTGNNYQINALQLREAAQAAVPEPAGLALLGLAALAIRRKR